MKRFSNMDKIKEKVDESINEKSNDFISLGQSEDIHLEVKYIYIFTRINV